MVVGARHGRVEAWGTRLWVSLQQGATQVEVYEGAVGVQVGLDSAQSGAGWPADFTRVIQAGECASFDQHRMLPGIQLALINHHQVLCSHFMLLYHKVNPYSGGLLLKAFKKSLDRKTRLNSSH
mgnify:CR=1 FL=1